MQTNKPVCLKCGNERTELGRIHRDGLCLTCRVTKVKTYQISYRPKKNAKRREEYKKNSIPKRLENKAWRERNREKVRESKRNWKRNNPNVAYRWDRMNPHKVKVIKDRSHLKRTYGMSVDDWDKLYALQAGKCAICECELTSYRPHVDHDHETGKVRNLLCAWCNHVVGVVEGHAEILERAKQYVARWKEVPHNVSSRNAA